MSIRWKLILTFFLVSILPLILAGGAGYFHINQVSSLAIQESARSLETAYKQLAEQKTLDIKKALEYFVSSKMIHEEKFNVEDLQFDPSFTSLGVQTFGKTGYSCILEKKKDKFLYFLHPNPKMIGKDITSLINRNIKFKRLFLRAGDKGFASDIAEISSVKSFYVLSNIEGTSLYILTKVNYSEIEGPVQTLEKRFSEEKETFLMQYYIGGLTTGALVLFIALWFSIRLARPIIYLTEVAERISLGELEAPIDITSTDEIGDLADALRRMQVSLRKAIQRLRRRSQRR
ncbi:HAMP domain-containing protein [Desulfonauticus submarinus]